MKRAVISGLVLVFVFSSPAWAQKIPLQYLMVNWQDGNMLSTPSTDAGVAIINQAADAGYNGIVWCDWRWEWYKTLTGSDKTRWTTNSQRIRQACRDRKMFCLPAITAMGATSSLLGHVNRNLAEGFPARNIPMVVQGGQLVPAATDPGGVDLANGFTCGFETAGGSVPTGWSWIDGWGTKASLDSTVKHGGSYSLKWCNLAGGNGRIVRTFNVQPYRAYHVRLWIKTENFTSTSAVRLQVLAAGTGQGLQQSDLMSNGDTGSGSPIAATQDWTRYDVVFNTLQYSQVNLYLGTWSGSGNATNIMWMDDMTIEPLGFFNVIRRPDAMPKVISLDGKTVYVEGRDYSKIGFEDKDDPAATSVEAIWTSPQAVTALTSNPKCKLHEGDPVLVSYNHMAEVGDWGQVCACLSAPGLYDSIAATVRNIHADLNPEGYFFEQDEMREGGWDDTCARTGKTPGQLLADNMRRCTSIIRKEHPPTVSGTFSFPLMFVWSDMFDKYHNAPTSGYYYLVKGNGPWQDSWKGLSTDVVIMNWNSANANSQKWFAGYEPTLQPLPLKQVLSCSGDSPSSVTGPLTTAAGVKNPDGSYSVIGVMYTTWSGTYTNLAAFATNVAAKCDLPPKLP